MASELKREARPRGDVPLRARSTRSPAETTPIRTSRELRWFDAIDPRAPVVARSYAFIYAIPPLVAAWVVALVAPTGVVRIAAPIALVGLALVVFLEARRAARAARLPRTRRGLSVTDDRLVFASGRVDERGDGSAARSVDVDLLYTDAPFGVTLLTDPKRERLTALLSSSAGTFSIGAKVDEPAKKTLASLRDVASIAGDELGLDAIGPDGEPLLMDAEDLRAVLEVLAERNPSCLERFVLSDARGAPITLEAGRLQIGEREFDLDAPLEWRSLIFRETLGAAHAYFQGTWVRQNGLELVLVSLLPAHLSLVGEDIGEMDLGALRDRRLMQATTEVPPPADQRIAIERLFMLPLRAALDRAPRPSHPSQRPDRAQA